MEREELAVKREEIKRSEIALDWSRRQSQMHADNDQKLRESVKADKEKVKEMEGHVNEATRHILATKTDLEQRELELNRKGVEVKADYAEMEEAWKSLENERKRIAELRAAVEKEKDDLTRRRLEHLSDIEDRTKKMENNRVQYEIELKKQTETA